MRAIPAALARETAEREHYMHRKPKVRHAFGLFSSAVQDEDSLFPEPGLVGIAVFGTPASHEVQVGACPSDPSMVIEFNRLWVDDRMPVNTESWFVSRCLARVPPYIVVSYADTRQGHLGYIYRALNFRYAGWTDMERKTSRIDYLPADPGTHTRDAFRNGYVAKARRRPKVKYWIVTGNRTDRKRLTKLCGWPSLDWKSLPPPEEHRQHKLTAGASVLTGRMVNLDVTSSRVTRGRQSEAIVAAHLQKHGWPDAERTPASLPGKDIQGTGELAFEVKARRGLNLPEWIDQAMKREGLLVLVIRHDGYGEAKLDRWAMVIPFGIGVELLRKAGYGCAGESNGGPGDDGSTRPEFDVDLSSSRR